MKGCVSVVFIVYIVSLGLASSDNKRLVLHSDFDIEHAIEALRQDNHALRQDNVALAETIDKLNASMKAEIYQLNRTMKAESDQKILALKIESDQRVQAIKTETAQKFQSIEVEIRTLQQSRGSTYVRWGRTVCPGNGTQKVYSGYAGGSPYDVDGGAASYVCLPEHPTWGYYKDGIQDIGGYMSGGEYEMYEPHGSAAFGKNMFEEDAPCVVCESPRPRVIMIPGSTQCYPGWSVEYTGYLLTGHRRQTGGTDYACLDVHPEAVLHGEADQNGKLFYFTEVKCGSLPCQEYPEGRELACTVCSK